MALSLADRLPDGSSVLLDTSPLVYLLEGSELAEPFEPVFAAIDAGRIEAVTTPITLAEVVAGPLGAGREALARQYARLLTSTPGWRMQEIDAELAMSAARLRARHRLKLPDALQVAAAVRAGCHALVTHDRDLSRVREILVLGIQPRRTGR